MTTSFAIDQTARTDPRPRLTPKRLAVVRAVLALVWAAAVVIALGGDVLSTASDVPLAAAILLTSYPAIDVLASILGAGASGRVLQANAAIGTLAILAIGAASLGADAGATLAAFGAWAAISGALQLGVATHRRRLEGRQVPLIVSGGLSTLAGLSFLAGARMDEAHLVNLAGYMALGALLFVVWALRVRPEPHAAQ